EALADCHNEGSFQVLHAKVESEDHRARATALEVLAKIGRPADAEALLKTFLAARNRDESGIALNGLRRLEDVSVDDLVRKTLASAEDSDERIKLIRPLADRGGTSANAELLKQAKDENAQI